MGEALAGYPRSHRFNPRRGRLALPGIACERKYIMPYQGEDPRLVELAAWAVEAGRALPMPAASIIAHEDRGDLVDLETGRIIAGGGFACVAPARTAKAVLHLTQGGSPCPTK